MEIFIYPQTSTSEVSVIQLKRGRNAREKNSLYESFLYVCITVIVTFVNLRINSSAINPWDQTEKIKSKIKIGFDCLFWQSMCMA